MPSGVPVPAAAGLPPCSGTAGWTAVAGAVARRPRLWGAAARQARRLAPRRWWRRPPFLPVPDRAWLRFRAETQYGDPDAVPDAGDVVTWLDWARRFPAVRN